jgi:hypothetical protein
MKKNEQDSNNPQELNRIQELNTLKNIQDLNDTQELKNIQGYNNIQELKSIQEPTDYQESENTKKLKNYQESEIRKIFNHYTNYQFNCYHTEVQANGSKLPCDGNNKSGLDFLYKWTHEVKKFNFKYNYIYNLVIGKPINEYVCIDIDGWCTLYNLGWEYDGPHHFFLKNYTSYDYRKYKNVCLNKIIKKEIFSRKNLNINYHSYDYLTVKNLPAVTPTENSIPYKLIFVPYFIYTFGLAKRYILSRLHDVELYDLGGLHHMQDIDSIIHVNNPKFIENPQFIEYIDIYNLTQYYKEIIYTYRSIYKILNMYLKSEFIESNIQLMIYRSADIIASDLLNFFNGGITENALIQKYVDKKF